MQSNYFAKQTFLFELPVTLAVTTLKGSFIMEKRNHKPLQFHYHEQSEQSNCISGQLIEKTF